ncbi:MAG: phage tail tape measure protein, partial [Bacteroidota bacterium]
KEYGEQSSRLRTVQKDLRKQGRELTKTIENSVKATRSAEGSNNRLRAILSEVTREYNQLSREQKFNTEEGREQARVIREISDELKRTEKALGDNRRNVGNYTDALSGMKGGFMDVVGSILGPAGALLAVSSLADVTSRSIEAVSEINKEYREYNGLVQQLSGLIGGQRDGLTAQIVSLSEVFNKDFREVLIAANAVSKEFGITLSDALEEIRLGFLAGNDVNGEYLDILSEYPAQIAQTGLSFQELNRITNVATSNGIFSDKGIDTLKEALIRIREFTPATAKAFDAIGISSEAIESGLREGTLEISEVIRQVSGRLSELPPQSKEVGQALADIFGGPGEDAGLRFITLLKDVEGSLDDVIDKSSSLTQAQISQLNSTDDLAEAKAKLSGTLDSFGISTVSIGNKIQEFLVVTLDELLKSLKILGITFESLGPAFVGLVDNLIARFDILKTNFLTNIQEIRKAFFNVLGDDEAVESISRSLENLANERSLARAREAGTGFGKAFSEAFLSAEAEFLSQSNSGSSAGITTQITSDNTVGNTTSNSGVSTNSGGSEAGSSAAEEDIIIPGLPPLSAIQDRANKEVEIQQIKFDRINEIADEANKKGISARKQSQQALEQIINEEIAAEQRKLNTFQALSALGIQIAGEQSLIGKLLGISSAITNTYVAANAGLATPPSPNFAAMIAAISAGLANVANIRKVPIPGVSAASSTASVGQSGITGQGTSIGLSQPSLGARGNSIGLSLPPAPGIASGGASGGASSVIASSQSQETQAINSLAQQVQNISIQLDVSEVNKVQNRIEVKERISRFG